MAGLTWLHLSDWHQRGKDFDRLVVRDALIKDIHERAKVSATLTQIDFIVFSGDVAFSGKDEEYEAAIEYLFNPVLEATELDRNRVFIVPGNHDLDRDAFELLPASVIQPFTLDTQVQEWLTNDRKRGRLLDPFEAYSKFVTDYTGQDRPDYASIRRLEVRGKQIALLGLNSAWMCGRNKDAAGEVNDYGFTIVGEPQIHDALEQIADANIRIVVLHHPFGWLAEFDRNRIEERLGRVCHFILRGHQHTPQVNVVRGTAGDCVIIPAGASYKRRVADDPRYTNAYNFVHLDFETGRGVVYLRRWSDRRNEWVEDTDSHEGGQFEFPLPKELGHPAGQPSAAPQTPAPAYQASATPSPPYERDKRILEIYLEALIRDTRELDPGGIRHTYKKATSAMPLDEIYIGLQADRDQPDVDRRVMQEELDEIKKRLEQIEDAKEREKQYQIWATHARTIQQALELTGGERVELSDIVQRHRQLVVLGDPGSGKTTLLRYLALRFARAVLEDVDRLFEEQDWWDYEHAWRLPDLWAVRLPLLMRISKYAEARNPKEGGDPDLPLADYLARYFVGHLQLPYSAEELAPVLRRCLDAGRCLVLLDGLDEIVDLIDRRDIAANINRFAGSFASAGLPAWVLRPLGGRRTAGPARLPSSYEGEGEEEDWEDVTDNWQWDKRVPEEVRQEWKKRWKEARRGARAHQMAYELLRDARSAHLGNRFVVTSRIAGYHFARVGGDFEHYTIRPMSIEDIERFLNKWCPVAERRIAEYPDPAQIERRAQQEIEGIMRAVREMPGVRRMAQNPLLLRILAIIHRNERHLPQRRVELYETATITLLRDWNLERGLGMEVVIDEHRAMGLLGPIAFWIHEHRPTGLLTRGEVEAQLGTILAREQGEDPENPSLAVKAAVEKFLDTVRQYSGIFVERGEGLFGFMHLTFEEYFTARQMVSRSSQAKTGILARLHQPRWREPTLLAVGFMSKNYYEDTHDLLRAILDHGSEYEPVLHRDLLFAAGCVGDSVNVAPVLIQEIACRLLALYSSRRGAGRYRRLQEQIKGALQALNNEQGNEAVEAALAKVLSACSDRAAMTCLLDAVEWLNPHTPAVAQALENCVDPALLPRARKLLRQVRARAENGGRPAGEGWDAYHDNLALARLLGAMWRYGWGDALSDRLSISRLVRRQIAAEWEDLEQPDTFAIAYRLDEMLDSLPARQRDAAFWQQVGELASRVYQEASSGSEIEATALRLINHARELVEGEEGESVQSVENELEKAVADFRQAVQRWREAVRNFDLNAAVEKSGLYILSDSSDSLSLAPVFVTAAQHLLSPEPAPDLEERLRDSLNTTQSDLAHALLDTLRTTDDAQQYREAALFLHAADEDTRREAIARVCADLEGSDDTRRGWALQVLSDHGFRENVEFTPERRALLRSLLDGPLPEAALALDILVALGFTPELLAWCWATLRRSNHPLTGTVHDKLDGLEELEGTAAHLALLDEGLRDKVLRSVALELLRKVKWQKGEILPYALGWLTGRDTQVRHLAALLLSELNDLYADARAVLVKAARERLEAISPLPGAGEGSEVRSWAALREDAQVVRLLGGLWLHGWDDALTQLWVAQPAQQYVDKKHPKKYWGHFRTYPESEDVIRWLLEKAEFSQSLIPLFQEAAQHLAEVEQEAIEEAPTEGHIALVQQEMTRKLEGIDRQTTTELALCLDATMLVSAIRGEEAEHTPENFFQEALDSADIYQWCCGLVRLARRQEYRQTVLATLKRGLSSSDRERRLLALTTLFDRQDLREAMADVLAERFLGDGLDIDETLIGLGLLLRLESPPADLLPWLRTLVTPDATHPLACWTRDQLARHELATNAAPSALARLLSDEDTDICTAAALTLLTTDLPALLLSALVEAAQSPDDRIRLKGQQRLYSVCYGKLRSDGSTSAIEDLHRVYQTIGGTGREETFLGGAVGQLNYESPHWPARWLDLVNYGSDEEQEFARDSLHHIGRASPEVIELLCQHLISTNQPERVRHAAMRALMEIRRYTDETRSDMAINDALITALTDPSTDIRRGTAYALQWTKGQGAWEVAHALLRTAQSDTDAETRLWALRSLGRVLHAVHGFRDVDASKEALFHWLTQKCPGWMEDIIKEMWKQPYLEETDDAYIALERLGHLDNLGLPEETATRLRDSEDWSKLLASAQTEWNIRRYWIETLPHLPAAIAEVESFLDAPDIAIRRAAACALARLYRGDDDRPARLRELLPANTAVLWAMLDAATDRDFWGDEGSGSPSHHPAAVKQIAGWVEAQTPDERARLIDMMLEELAHQAAEMERKMEEKQDNAEDEDDFAEDWPIRRILISVLAELSERLTYRAFTRSRDLAEVVDLLARAARDPNSYSARRFAIGALGNLQQLTANVADVFFEACQDVGSVYRETRMAVTKFKVFGPGSLERLTQAVSSESITVAYHAALLLGELGVSRSEELGREGRQRVANELYHILQDPLSERIVYDFSEGSDSKRVGPLYDVVYEALLQVVSGEALEETAPTATEEE